ncbi:ATP-binding cassette domain-containing protein [Kallipyga gabonensis]|uniref:ATP-binding cassette domain-containing protein n=1 Tax=Kallipyga gabonensis TaxID=1686287 RepID=UPI0006B5E19D|nr:ATP-binding cassette domain-containing protein [Kallipyga gabonensis]
MGKSGAGKTTLLHMVAGLDRLTSGHIFYDDLDITRLKEHEMARFRASHIGIVLQNFALLLNESKFGMESWLSESRVNIRVSGIRKKAWSPFQGAKPFLMT